MNKNEPSQQVLKNNSPITKLEAKKWMAQNIADQCNMLSKKIDKELSNIMRVMKQHEKILGEINKKNNVFIDLSESVDVTLSNVLLAIKQNEFLQAWYPPQNGKPAQKVVGKYKE